MLIHLLLTIYYQYMYICLKTNDNTTDMLSNSTGFRKCMFTCLTWNLVVGDIIYVLTEFNLYCV